MFDDQSLLNICVIPGQRYFFRPFNTTLNIDMPSTVSESFIIKHIFSIILYEKQKNWNIFLVSFILFLKKQKFWQFALFCLPTTDIRIKLKKYIYIYSHAPIRLKYTYKDPNTPFLVNNNIIKIVMKSSKYRKCAILSRKVSLASIFRREHYLYLALLFFRMGMAN